MCCWVGLAECGDIHKRDSVLLVVDVDVNVWGAGLGTHALVPNWSCRSQARSAQLIED